MAWFVRSQALPTGHTSPGQGGALVAEGASDQEILEIIRADSPEIAEVVEHAPVGAELREWASFVVQLLVLLLAYRALVQQDQDAEQTHEDLTQIAKLLEVTLKMLRGDGDIGGGGSGGTPLGE